MDGNKGRNKMKIIGITGHPASGKDTVADFLVGRGWNKVSGGDILREQMTELGIPIDRASMHEFVSGMRQKHGNGYLCEETMRRIQGETVISGIRNREEVQIFREKLGAQGADFQLWAVEAPLRTRYEWAKERNRIGDEVSFEEFTRQEDLEKKANSGSHEVDLVIAGADLKIINDGTLEDLYIKVIDNLGL